MFGPISFRRILLSRILLLSVPVLFIGQFLTYRQVRLSLLETMHDSLVQSAQRKGEDLSRFVTTLRLSASVAREASPIMAGDFVGSQRVFERLSQQLPDSVECIWLESIANGEVLANTCAAIETSVPPYAPPIASASSDLAATNPASELPAKASFDDAIEIRTFFMPIDPNPTAAPNPSIERPPSPASSPKDPENSKNSANPSSPENSKNPDPALIEKQTYFLLDAPVTPLNATAPQYVLRLMAQLPSEHRNSWTPSAPSTSSDLNTPSFSSINSDRLSNATLIVNATNVVLSYPLGGYVGQMFQDLPDYTRLLQRTQENSEEFAQRAVLNSRIFNLDHDTHQAIVGHVLIPDPTLSPSQLNRDRVTNPQWIVMAVADLDLALQNLAAVRGVMFNLVLLLLAANLVATLFLTRDLARPLERLGRYARNIECNVTPDALPARFSIHEFNQLAIVMNASIERLKAWAKELSAAWQNARQANQLKNEFLTTISHELRTPLNGIIGSVRLVRDGFCEDHDEELEFLQRADDSALHLLAIIDDILDISKIEAGTVSISPEHIDLRQIVLEAIELQKHEVESKALDLPLDLGDASTMVYVDPSKLRRVLVNIIGNAVKFTEVGQITIAIQIRAATLAPDTTDTHKKAELYAAIEVQDTGIGIDPRHQDKLFEPFVMVDGTTTRQFGGTGLGLAISRNLLEMMDSYIAIQSLGLQRGTTVTIEIPLSRNVLPEAVLTSPTSSPEAPPDN